MKAKILISSLSLIAASAYAQPSMPAGASPSANRPEVSRPATPSMPQPAMQRPAPQPAVGATGGTGGNGGNGGLIIGTGGTGGAGGAGATPKPSVTMYNGVGPLPANDAKAPLGRVGGEVGSVVNPLPDPTAGTDLKPRVADVDAMPADQLRLIFNGKQLNNQ